jgi:hypothetical protein
MIDGHGVKNSRKILAMPAKIRFSGRQEKFHQRYRSPDLPEKVWSELDFVKLLIISDLLKFSSLLRGSGHGRKRVVFS